MQFKSESGANFLKIGARAVFVKFIPVVSKEYKISLIVQGDHTTGLQMGILREQTGKHPTHTVAQHRIEVI